MTKHAAICQSTEFWDACNWTTYDGTVINNSTTRDAYYYCKYTTIGAYQTAQWRGLTEHEIVEIIGPWATPHPAVSIATWGTWDTCTFTLVTVGVARYQGIWPTGSEFRIETSAASEAFITSCSYFVGDGIPGYHTATNRAVFSYYAYSHHQTFRNCFSKGGSSGFSCAAVASGAGGFKAENCVAIDAYSSGFVMNGAIYSWTEVVNCTAYHNNLGDDWYYNGGFRIYGSGGGYTKFINCVGIGNLRNDFVLSGARTLNNCISGDSTTSSGTNCYTGRTLAETFSNAASGDFSLPSTSFARDKGTKIVGVTPKTDIIGVYRDATYDIGAFEYNTNYTPSETLTINNLATGSAVRVTRADTGAVLTTGVESSGSCTVDIAYSGNIYVEARCASSSPSYKQWRTLVNFSTSQTISALQELD